MRKKLTDRTLKSLKPARADAAPVDIMDSVTPGFGVRVMGTPTHPVRTFILRTRFPGSKNPTRARIGSYDETDKLSLEGARDKAREWLAAIRRGHDPRLEEERRRRAELERLNTTFAAIAEAFIAEKLPGERRGAHVARELRNEFLPLLGKLPAADINDEHIIRIIRAKAKAAPSQARNLYGHISRLFDWAISQRTFGLKVSPCASITIKTIVGKKTTRDRVLDDDEVHAFWQAALRMPYPAGSVYRLLLLTGLRLNEVAGASWKEFSSTIVRTIRQRGTESVDWSQFQVEQMYWEVPAERMKGQNGSARAHVVPLTPQMLAILEELPQFVGGDFLFSHNAGRTPAVISSDIKKALDEQMLLTLRELARQRGDDPKAIELQPWRNHDLRRVVRSGLSRLKISDAVAEAVLAHVKGGVRGIYDRHDYYDDKLGALTAWGARLRGIVEPAAVASNIVPMRKAEALT
jgi:integrase